MTFSRDIDLFLCWIEVAQQHGRMQGIDVRGLRVDANHSALLRRMLSGKDPLPRPPPLNHSYPWYDLIDNNQAHPIHVDEHRYGYTKDGNDTDTNPVRLVIDQHPWMIRERLSKESWTVSYFYSHLKGPSPWVTPDDALHPDDVDPRRWIVRRPMPHEVQEREGWVTPTWIIYLEGHTP